MHSIKRWLCKIGWIGFILVLFVVVVELASRCIHGFVRPCLPIYYERGIPRIPYPTDLKIEIETCSDTFRISSENIRTPVSEKPLQRCGLLVVGDSQVLGYGIPFTDTFAYRLAEEEERLTDFGVLASPQWDPTLERRALKSLPLSLRQTVQQLIVAVNFGNDLDELYFSGDMDTSYSSPTIHKFLISHSYLYLDLCAIWSELTYRGLPPGANPVVLATSSFERAVLIDAIAHELESMKKGLPGCHRFTLVIIPPDYVVNAAEFDKYRTSYPNDGMYLAWKSRLPQMTQAMDASIEYMAVKARSVGFSVIDPEKALKAKDSTKLFDRQSHHLTRYGNEVILNLLITND